MTYRGWTYRRMVLGLAVAGGLARPVAGYDMRFDVVTFNATPEGSADHMNQYLFNDLNYRSANGHVLAMGTDDHRPEVTGAGNVLAAYYNSWTNLYNGQPVGAKDGAAAADAIHSYVTGRFTDNGPRPTWVLLNEISPSLWPSNETYRQWAVDTVTRLHDVYGYEVIAYSPFSNPAANDAWWQQLSAKAYVGVEHYLSGEEVKAQNFSLSWVQSKYASSITSYQNRGVAKGRLILTEEFAHTAAGTGWGRAGVSLADWEATIRVRSQAIYNLGFGGFSGYAWSKNAMGVSDAEMLYAEDVYRSTMVLPSERPHWMAGGGGSWNTRNNWIAAAGVPNGVGAVATFGRNITASSATVTLDGSKTVGVLTFDTARPVTIAPGSGGALTMDNGGVPPGVVVLAGSHVIAAPLALASPADVVVSSGASLAITGTLTGRVRSLMLAGSGKLDVGANVLVYDYDLPAGSPRVAVRGMLLSGRNGGGWNGPGLVSSVAAGDGARRIGLGYVEAADLPVERRAGADASAVIVKLAWYGDANVDGRVDWADYALVDRGFARGLAAGAAVWADGDFDYDGAVTAADYLLIDRAFLQKGAAMSAGFLAEREARFGEGYVAQLMAAVPEPESGIVLVAAMIVGRLRRGVGRTDVSGGGGSA